MQIGTLTSVAPSLDHRRVIGLAYGLAKLVLPRRKGDEKVLRFVGANESFGEAAVLLDRPCPVDVVALADAMLAVIPVRALKQLQERDLTFANNLVRTLAYGLVVFHFTVPFFMSLSMSRVTSRGAVAPGMSTAPTTRSASASSASRTTSRSGRWSRTSCDALRPSACRW